MLYDVGWDGVSSCEDFLGGGSDGKLIIPR